MAKPRTYKLLCPIARALDRIGDRWTLLILRDLHAGPARFSDLQRGLTGIAANLLTERLAKLVGDGLASKADAGHGATVYELTDHGKRTADIILELAMFGAQFEPEGEVVPPGNLRTVATTMGVAANRAALPAMSFDAAFVVDDEQMHLKVKGGSAEMTYEACRNPDLIFSTSYAALLDVTEGKLDPMSFISHHSTIQTSSPTKQAEFFELMSGIVAVLGRT
ncbi:winged helix-turn-helix transcriptional regulator [uncultured Litoreibacter sp.]|uniref:winged helix-turn-helix transcriptional regulator n=1 Tax=uncultured Litoreibacter sp. TaxID=1392394 RepID=UPI00260E9ABF|nr:winged helix-turn-helix transcriptional regulator [uncultured Litoreibacter sp.]